MKSRRRKNKGVSDKMFDKDDYPILENLLNLFFKDNKIEKPSGRTDIYDLAKKMSFDIKYAFIEPQENVKVEGILLVDENKEKIGKFSGPRGIALNCLNTPRENRFIVAHELSHYIFEKFLVDYKPVVLTGQRLEHMVGKERDDFEQAIDYMAAATLIPLDQFDKQYEKAKEGQRTMQDFVEEMSSYYNVPTKAIEKRINELAELKKND